MSTKEIKVNAKALHDVLHALVGPGHHIRELQATRLFPDNPINTLIREFNAQVENAETPQRDVSAFTLEGSRRCKGCGWTLPEKFIGYIGGCPRCMLKLCGEKTVPIKPDCLNCADAVCDECGPKQWDRDSVAELLRDFVWRDSVLGYNRINLPDDSDEDDPMDGPLDAIAKRLNESNGRPPI